MSHVRAVSLLHVFFLVACDPFVAAPEPRHRARIVDGCFKGQTVCGGACVFLSENIDHCGQCGSACALAESCDDGVCRPHVPVPLCPPGHLRCGAACRDAASDPSNCGACGVACAEGEQCVAGACSRPPPPCTDCDGDGWRAADGDCSDDPGADANAAEVNPAAIELPGNGADDDCNGLTDLDDRAAIDACDGTRTGNVGVDHARALGLCRRSTEQARTWGVVSAELLHADGTPLTTPDAASLRSAFGKNLPLEGAAFSALSTGGATSERLGHAASLVRCDARGCLADWLAAANAPVKRPHELPVGPGCGSGTAHADVAYDSVVLEIRVRAPSNARGFALRTLFASAEYPASVCTDFHDQAVVLVDTPGGPAKPANPADGNLFVSAGWPIGIDLARATPLLGSCAPATVQPGWQSCSQGAAALEGTGFEAGAATGWLETSGSVRPGEIVTLRIAVWDVADALRDTLLLVDDFRWLPVAAVPGTR